MAVRIDTSLDNDTVQGPKSVLADVTARQGQILLAIYIREYHFGLALLPAPLHRRIEITARDRPNYIHLNGRQHSAGQGYLGNRRVQRHWGRGCT